MLSRCAARFLPPRTFGTKSLWQLPDMGKDAVTALNSIQSNFSIVDAFRKSGSKKNESAIAEMLDWCRRGGVDVEQLNRLNLIHIAGTKGKGSTSAFISSILAQYQDANKVPTKIGLYTSPHLRFVRERIQIDNAPISEQDFADSFFEVWDRIQDSAKQNPIPEGQPPFPVYFRFLTILAFHTYLKQGVDSAMIECGIGGEYDSTNVLQKPVTTGISALGIDHVAMLGDTVEKIAWHKAGIMKPGVPLFTVNQPGGALQVLRERAEEKGVDLYVVPEHPEITAGKVQLGLAGEFQKSNASLAVEIAASHLRSLGHQIPNTSDGLPEKFVRGLQDVHFGGRCETRREPGLTWRIDGAHTIESMDVASKWFAECIQRAQQTTAPGVKPRTRILLFNQQTRSGESLLHKLHEVLSIETGDAKPITHAIFCSNLTFEDTGYRPDLVSVNANKDEVESLEVQEKLAHAWKTIAAETQVSVVRSIEQAVRLARQFAQGSGDQDVQVFATGSLHLIGGVLEVLESDSVPTAPGK